MAAREPRCSECGGVVAAEVRTCPACGASQLVDLMVTSSLTRPRTIYLAARAILAADLGAPPLAEVRTRVEQAPGPVVLAVTRAVAADAQTGLARIGVRSHLVASQRRPGGSAGPQASTPAILGRLERAVRAWPLATLAVVALAAALGGLLLATRGTAPGGQQITSEPSTEQEEPHQTAPGRQVAARAIAASVMVRSGSSQGTGFFVDNDRLVTAAHVLAGGPGTIEVVLAGGRTLEARLEREDRWLDLAVIRTIGSGIDPLITGDVTRLEEGDPLLVVGNPVGLDFSVVSGIVSRSERCLMGVSYLQIDSGIHAGNSGGPVLDADGSVVGVVVMTLLDAPNLALAVPINYLIAGPSPLLALTRDPGEQARWSDVILRAAEAERRELEQLRPSLDRPALVAAQLVPPGLIGALIVRSGQQAPRPESLRFELVRDSRELCRPSGQIVDWQRLRSATSDISRSRYLTWLQRHDLLTGLYAGTVHLEMSGCPAPGLVLGSTLVLTGGDPRANQAEVYAAGPG